MISNGCTIGMSCTLTKPPLEGLSGVESSTDLDSLSPLLLAADTERRCRYRSTLYSYCTLAISVLMDTDVDGLTSLTSTGRLSWLRRPDHKVTEPSVCSRTSSS